MTHAVIRDSSGFLRLDPIPNEDDLAEFYNAEYHQSLKEGGRAPALARLTNGGHEEMTEHNWLSKAWWLDIKDILFEHLGETPGKHLLDVGCGSGHFANYMEEDLWHVIGIEPSREAAAMATNGLGIEVYPSLSSFMKTNNEQQFDAITLLNVLEHVPNPKEVLEDLSAVIQDDGVLVLRVPNDFTELQACAQRALNTEKRWWIAIPDHINYFNFDSLTKLLDEVGFDVVDKIGDFPMEMFLLFGDDYTSDPTVGEECHKKRQSFELAITPELRRNIYRSLAQTGVGRSCVVFAKLR